VRGLSGFGGFIRNQRVAAPGVGSYPIVTPQYSSTTLYQVSYHIQSLCFEVTIGSTPSLAAARAVRSRAAVRRHAAGFPMCRLAAGRGAMTRMNEA
jgi:hypothetical protein